jgi:ABC-2 type transport system permease protein
MRNSLLIAIREWKARVFSRSFIVMSIIGPIVILALTYLLFVFGDNGKQEWNVLITDPAGIMDGKINSHGSSRVTYSFANDYIEHEDFRDGKAYQDFDAMVEINDKVLQNKVSHVFYRSEPSTRMQTTVHYHVERRLEEVMVGQFTDFSIGEYLKIKQELVLGFHNVYDPYDKATDLRGWVGFSYGALIFVFIFLFGMTILRSVSGEKSNRIVEVLLASVSPNQLMSGKIIGIGLAAIIQFLIWCFFIGLGLYFMRENLFPDMMDPQNVVDQELFASAEYNRFVELIYRGIDYGIMVPFFILFFIVGYLFYGALFAGIGATMGTESDGQQFVIPIIFLLGFGLYSGYYVVNYPESDLATWFYYLPFTSPVAVMVDLAQSDSPGYETFLSLFILIVSAAVFLKIAGRLYKNGILQFGHRVRLRHIIKWLRRS